MELEELSASLQMACQDRNKQLLTDLQVRID